VRAHVARRRRHRTVAAAALNLMYRVGRQEECAWGGQLRNVLCKLRCKIARVSVALPPLCARIGARRGLRSAPD
jgi:hypothetical protein